jgi:hypothetical protein
MAHPNRGRHIRRRHPCAGTVGAGARSGAKTDTVEAPRFEVDPAWPKPLPNNWMIGMAIGVGIDARDHVWIVHRQNTLAATEVGADQNPPTAECCKTAPPVLEFDTDGTLLRSWGGPGQGYEWPESNHGIFIDHKGIVWMGGNVGADSQVPQVHADGKFVAQFGRRARTRAATIRSTSAGRKNLRRSAPNEAYIADGYSTSVRS